MTSLIYRALALAVLPALAFGGLQSDIEYGRAEGVSLKLDAYVPDGPGPFASVIVVHGGGWSAGDKQKNAQLLFAPLTKAGFAWFTINYRLWPQYHYPAAVDDLVTAIRFVREHAAEYKVDRGRIAICGESAGGHLVSLVGARYGRDLSVAAVVAFYAPSDMESLAFGEDSTAVATRAVSGFLGIAGPGPQASKLLREASPLTWVKRDMPPFLLIHGTADKTVPFAQSLKMEARIKQVGARCELFPVEGAPHWFGAWEKDPPLHRYKSVMIEWLKRTMNAPVSASIGLLFCVRL
jgi:acetyl esterase